MGKPVESCLDLVAFDCFDPLEGKSKPKLLFETQIEHGVADVAAEHIEDMKKAADDQN